MDNTIQIELTPEEAFELLQFLQDSPNNKKVVDIMDFLEYSLEEVEPINFEE